MLNFDSRRLSHAYIADGNAADIIVSIVVCSERNETGPCTLCKHCQKAAKKIHPDIMEIKKASDKSVITVDQIRELKKDVIVVPNEAERKVYVINDAHLLKNPEAQNAFLQILEEPPKHVVFILKTDFPAKLLPTILSRCIHVKSDQNDPHKSISKSIAFTSETNESNDDHDSTTPAIEFFAAIEKGNPAIVEFMFTVDKLNKEQFSDFISSARNEATRLLRETRSGNGTIQKSKIAKTDELLIKAYDFLDQNVNIGHISGYICANLIDAQ